MRVDQSKQLINANIDLTSNARILLIRGPRVLESFLIVFIALLEDCALNLKAHDLVGIDSVVSFKLFNVRELVANLIVDLDKLRADTLRAPSNQSLSMALPSFSKLLVSQKNHRLNLKERQAEARFLVTRSH
jgi:hypothetical protein